MFGLKVMAKPVLCRLFGATRQAFQKPKRANHGVAGSTLPSHKFLRCAFVSAQRQDALIAD